MRWIKQSEQNYFIKDFLVQSEAVVLILVGFLGLYFGGIFVNKVHIFPSPFVDCQFLLIPPAVGLFSILLVCNLFYKISILVLFEIRSSKNLSLRLTLLLFGIFFLLTLISFVLDFGYHIDDIQPKTNIDVFLSSNILIVSILLFQVTFEEIVFRRLIYNIIGNYISTQSIAIIISGFIFSMAHAMNFEYEVYGFSYLISIFIVGVFLQYLFLETNSLALPILIHFTSNLLSLFVLQLESLQLDIPSLFVRTNFSVWTDMIILLLQIVIFVFLFKRIKPSLNEN